jgi:proteic killer suppression protein
VAGIQPRHAKRLRMLLAALDTAQSAEDMNVSRVSPAPTQGNRSWSLVGVGKWKLALNVEFEGGHAYLSDYEDYH